MATISKAFKTTCFRCKKLLNVNEMTMMCDDHAQWSCDNCGSNFSMYCKTVPQGEDYTQQIKVFKTSRSDTTTAKVFTYIGKTFKEAKE